jgi:hypothetical protein
VTTQRKISTAGVRVHRCELTSIDVMRVGSLPVTTPVRTLLDLAAVLDEDRLEDCLEEALTGGSCGFLSYMRRFDALGTRGRKGAGTLHRLLEMRGAAWAPNESELKACSSVSCGEPTPSSPRGQYEVWDGPNFIARLDFAYPNERVAIFADSYKWHGQRRTWEKDIHQRNKLQALAWRIRPTTWTELRSRPEEFVADVVLLRRSAA